MFIKKYGNKLIAIETHRFCLNIYQILFINSTLNGQISKFSVLNKQLHLTNGILFTSISYIHKSVLMAISANLFIRISISCQTHSFLECFQNFEPENPRTKMQKCCQNTQLKFLNSIYNQLIYICI